MSIGTRVAHLLVICLTTVSSFASTTQTVTVNSFGGDAPCTALPACVSIYPQNAPGKIVTINCTFTDPASGILPPAIAAAATVQQITVAASIAKGDPYPVSPTYPASSVSFAVDGLFLGGASYASGGTVCPTTGPAYSASFTSDMPGYIHGGQNSLMVQVADGDATIAQLHLVVKFAVPDLIEFSATDASPQTDLRILLSNQRLDYPYPFFQALGAEDGAVSLFLRAKNDQLAYQSGLPVYLRIVDPPDSAAYANLTSPNVKLAHDNDNAGGVATLDGSGVSPVAGQPGVYQAISGADGIVHFTLRLHQAAAGDNYQVEAAFDPSFPAAVSWRSAPFVAWKRIFVEKRRMLRNGIRLAAAAQTGDSSIRVVGNKYRGNQGKHSVVSGDVIVLVHAPSLDGHDASSGWHFETHNVLSATADPNGVDYVVALGTKAGKAVYPEHLQYSYSDDPTDPLVGDAIARLAGSSLSSIDYYDAADDLVGPLFAGAFVEYVVLPGDATAVPIPFLQTSNSATLQNLANRWISSVTLNAGLSPTAPPNYQLLIIGADDGSVPIDTVGQTTLGIAGQKASFVWRAAINSLVSTNTVHNGQDPESWATKNEAHELSHEWSVDAMWTGVAGASLQHCPPDTTTYDAVPGTPIYCVLATTGTTQSETQSDNMIAAFHLRQLPATGEWHSEYFEIRRRPDPFVP